MNEENKVIYSSSRGDHEIVYADGFFSQFGGLVVNWRANGVGFGEAYFSYDKERGSLRVDSEMMGPEFISKVMEKLVRDTLFTDFQEAIKSVQPISLEDANSMFPFRDNVLHTPFYEENDKENKNLIQMRWNIEENKVLNIWFDKSVLGEKLDDSLNFCMEICQNKNFDDGFVKAEVWSWTIKKKQKD